MNKTMITIFILKLFDEARSSKKTCRGCTSILTCSLLLGYEPLKIVAAIEIRIMACSFLSDLSLTSHVTMEFDNQ